MTNENNRRNLESSGIEISTYLLTSVTIYLLRAQLAEYHINPIMLAIVILGKLMRLVLCCSGKRIHLSSCLTRRDQ